MRRGIHCPSSKHFGIRCFRLVVVVLTRPYVLVCSIPNSIPLFYSAVFPCLSISFLLPLPVVSRPNGPRDYLSIQVHHSEESWTDDIVLYTSKNPYQPSTQ
ncbi:hypothetical protein COCCADRAFT_99688 [Bipolaris zeicola 26-R-13]|uniref:Uncharacterized protein n=1 Tax=Cochliobolus carbonum (strain 26-R-13) TaxID=930089 RepID=W6YKZ5_COCC2|nr:uncharacterized protein COCCADRAFT_99688 [Bipolaris zeicola 26-R-13]EUC32056.1 hypothetical protein COCCADRAFT_99688 [Bipolaris zeicola 26-R-13]